MVIYFEVILFVSASLGHHQEYLNTRNARRKTNYKYTILICIIFYVPSIRNIIKTRYNN